VVYEPGEISVVAYKDGKAWARDSRTTAGAPARLDIAADRAVIAADGQDLAFVTAKVLDADSHIVPRAALPIRFSLDGDGEIVATDNGDPTDMTPFPSPQRKAFNGLALAIVRFRPGARGPLTLRAQTPGLPQARLTLRNA
jgi:beta-galactosidase